jgi:hypothetical protein
VCSKFECFKIGEPTEELVLKRIDLFCAVVLQFEKICWKLSRHIRPGHALVR